MDVALVLFIQVSQRYALSKNCNTRDHISVLYNCLPPLAHICHAIIDRRYAGVGWQVTYPTPGPHGHSGVQATLQGCAL